MFKVGDEVFVHPSVEDLPEGDRTYSNPGNLTLIGGMTGYIVPNKYTSGSTTLVKFPGREAYCQVNTMYLVLARRGVQHGPIRWPDAFEMYEALKNA